MKLGMDPRKSSNVCNFTAALLAHGKTEVRQSGGVQGIDGIGQLHGERLQSLRTGDEALGKIRLDASRTIVGFGRLTGAGNGMCGRPSMFRCHAGSPAA